VTVIGNDLEPAELVLVKNRDFKWAFQNLDDSGAAVNFPAGTLYFEVYITSTPTVWAFTISGSTASIKVESEVVNTVPTRSAWQLVFRPTGEPAGGDALARGTVRVLS
jgi:hypothetical protein